MTYGCPMIMIMNLGAAPGVRGIVKHPISDGYESGGTRGERRAVATRCVGALLRRPSHACSYSFVRLTASWSNEGGSMPYARASDLTAARNSRMSLRLAVSAEKSSGSGAHVVGSVF